jgi:hypothetical protein
MKEKERKEKKKVEWRKESKTGTAPESLHLRLDMS